MTWDSNTYRSHTKNNINNVMPYDIWKQYEIDPINKHYLILIDKILI